MNVHLATAPVHPFVRYTDPQGVGHNLETTSGGHEARTEMVPAELTDEPQGRRQRHLPANTEQARKQCRNGDGRARLAARAASLSGGRLGR